MSTTREPYRPGSDEWTELYYMLCGHCAHQTRCEVVEGMIEMKDGSPWPDGGWVSDPGAGVTCLTYLPKMGQPVSRQHLRFLARKLPPVCDGCAALKGSEASVSLHTRRDYASAVQNKTRFDCHERTGQPCGGWCRAVTRRQPWHRTEAMTPLERRGEP